MSTRDPSQPPAPPGCVFGPHNLHGAWVAVVEGASTGTLAAVEWCDEMAQWDAAPTIRCDGGGANTRAAIFSAAFSHARKVAAAERAFRKAGDALSDRREEHDDAWQEAHDEYSRAGAALCALGEVP